MNSPVPALANDFVLGNISRCPFLMSNPASVRVTRTLAANQKVETCLGSGR